MDYTVSPNIKGLIFDLDGTLVDSMPAHFLSWKAAFRKHGCEFDEAFFYANAGVSLAGVVGLYNAQHKLNLDAETVVKDKNAAHLKYLEKTQLIEPVFAVVRKYHGTLPMAIASGNSRDISVSLLEMLGIGHYFGIMVFGTDVKNPKPHPECFLTAAKQMGIAPGHCEVFEDGEPGLQGAIAAGMKATDIRAWLT